MEIFRTLIASYLIVTLGSTALAKAKNYRVASIGVQREMIIPARVAAVIIISLVIFEFALATLLMIGSATVVTGFATGALFVVFAAYRLLVSLKTKSLTCSCAGTIRTDPASVPSVAGASLACIIMAALGFIIAFLGRAEYPDNFLAVAAWIAPIVSFAAGARLGLRRPNTNISYPTELHSLWTAEIERKR